MLHSIFVYGLETSLCMLILIGAYYILLRRLTFFSWMRYYLLASVVVSLVLPLINISIWDIDLFSSSQFLEFPAKQISMSQELAVNNYQNEITQSTRSFDLISITLYTLLLIYSIGFIFKAYSFFLKIRTLLRYIKNNPKIKENNYWIVTINQKVPAFSFFNYIFINRQLNNLSDSDFNIMLKHESLHVKQFHTYDILFIELISIAFWFNPLIIYVEKLLQELHEFIVDEKIVSHEENKKTYSKLLLNLTSERNLISLSAGFTGYQITRRLKMISKPRSLVIKKHLFLIIVPLAAVLLLSFSQNTIKNVEIDNIPQNSIISNLKVGKIIWNGNFAYSDDVLNKIFELKSGDEYNSEDAAKLLNKSVGTLYLDRGYIFYYGKIVEHKNDEIVNLEISIFEGNKGKIGKISVIGNNKVSESLILGKMKLKSGDLFSRTKLNESTRSIRRIKNISDKTTMNPNPILGNLTEGEYYLIDLEIIIIEN